MSTRAVIARKTETGFSGVYHHWDGYPSGLGATLFELHSKQFNRDTGAMCKALIDEHPAGWSTINGADWTKPIGYASHDAAEGETPGPQCYCHGNRKEKGSALTEKTAAGCGCEYAYVFQDNWIMEVWSSYRQNGHKMIGMFGQGDPQSLWKTIAVVHLGGKEPDWKAIDESA